MILFCRMTRRWPLVWLFLLAALTTGCQFGGPGQRPPCDCPNTEAIVWSIDWLGDGSAADVFDSGESFGGWPAAGVVFNRFSDADEARTALQVVYTRLETAGLGSVSVPRTEVELVLEDAIVTIDAFFLEAPDEAYAEFAVGVEVLADDGAAADVLQPLVAALGTIDE